MRMWLWWKEKSKMQVLWAAEGQGPIARAKLFRRPFKQATKINRNMGSVKVTEDPKHYITG